MTSTAPLAFPQEALDEFCHRHHIARLSLFGSRQAGTARPDSDLDLLAEFEQGRKPGYLRLSGMQIELSALLGLPVDLRTPEELSPHFREDVRRNARPVYARG